jgi:hypothetical protein
VAAARAGAGKLLGRGGCRSRWHPLVERTHDVSITSRFASNYHDFMTRAEAATEIPLRFYSWYHRFVIKLRIIWRQVQTGVQTLQRVWRGWVAR